jgi:hypothetical protein
LCAGAETLSEIAFVCDASAEERQKQMQSEFGAFVIEVSVSGVLLSTYL